MLKRPKMEVGIRVLPRTRTSRVPRRRDQRKAFVDERVFRAFEHLSIGAGREAEGGHTVASLVKAMLRIAMACKYDHLMATVLEADGGVNNEPLGTADA